MPPRLTLIFATDSNGLFGLNGTIPWKCPEDLKHFNRITSNIFETPYLVMGRKTFQSLPKKLEGRTHIILSSSKEEVPGADYVFKSFEEVLKGFSGKNLFIIGGSSLIEEVYTKYKALIDTIYYTEIHQSTVCSEDDQKVYMKKDILEDILKNVKREKVTAEATYFHITLPKHEEFQYLDLLSSCLDCGSYRKTRNASTFSTFNKTISFDLKKGFPLLTTKKVFMRGIFEELLFFLKGHTDSKELESKGVNIWKPNTTKEFIASCGLPYEEGDMGPMYGWNWKHFGAEYVDKKTDYTGQGFNQIEYAMNLLRSDPFSRRILMTTYNPATAGKGVLYPCHSLVIQYYCKEVAGNYFVSMNMYQRSVDLACGLPFNIASNALLLHLVCETLNARLYFENNEKHTIQYIPDMMNIILGDIHVYEQHVEGVKEQIERIPFTFPTLRFKSTYESIEDYKFEDIEVVDYKSHPAIRYEMIA